MEFNNYNNNNNNYETFLSRDFNASNLHNPNTQRIPTSNSTMLKSGIQQMSQPSLNRSNIPSAIPHQQSMSHIRPTSQSNYFTNNNPTSSYYSQPSNYDNTASSNLNKSNAQKQADQMSFFDNHRHITKDELLGVESLDSLAVFMRDHNLNNSENYPFYNNYNPNSIAHHQSIVYKTILEGNKYNNTNIGIIPQSQSKLNAYPQHNNNNIAQESHEQLLDRRMRAIAAQSSDDSATPNQQKGPISTLQLLQQLKRPDYYETPDEIIYENDRIISRANRDGNNDQLNDGQYEYDDQEDDQTAGGESTAWIKGMVEPFREEDFRDDRINNKFFDNLAWYQKELVDSLPKSYDFNRLAEVRKDRFTFYVDDSININNPSNNNNNKQFLGNGEVKDINYECYLYKFDLDRGYFKQQRLQLNGLHRFAWVQVHEREEVFVCGGRVSNVAQKGCMYLDFSLNKSLLRSELFHARYDHVLLQLEETIYIIGGQGEHGETLLACEGFNRKNARIRAISNLNLSRRNLTGTVSTLNRCLYVAGVPLISEDNAIQIERFETHTNFWHVLSIQVNYLGLKQPKYATLAVYAESIGHEHMYIFCQDLNRYENYAISVHDLSGDHYTKETQKAGGGNPVLDAQLSFNGGGIAASMNVIDSNVEQGPFRFVEMFNDQVRLNYINKKKYEDAVREKKRKAMEQEKWFREAQEQRLRVSALRESMGRKVKDFVRGENESEAMKMLEGESVKIQAVTSDFDRVEALLIKDAMLFVINRKNPVEIEKFDFRDWKKHSIVLKFSKLI